MPTNRKIALLVILVVAIGALFALTRTQTIQADKGVTWRTDFNAASRDAAKNKKPIMIDFYADWCGWCKKLDSEVYSNDKVIAASRKFVSVKLDTDKDRVTPGKYKVEGLPTIVFLKPDGKEISRVVGYKPAGDFLKEMNKALEASKKK